MPKATVATTTSTSSRANASWLRELHLIVQPRRGTQRAYPLRASHWSWHRRRAASRSTRCHFATMRTKTFKMCAAYSCRRPSLDDDAQLGR